MSSCQQSLYKWKRGKVLRSLGMLISDGFSSRRLSCLQKNGGIWFSGASKELLPCSSHAWSTPNPAWTWPPFAETGWVNHPVMLSQLLNLGTSDQMWKLHIDRQDIMTFIVTLIQLWWAENWPVLRFSGHDSYYSGCLLL